MVPRYLLSSSEFFSLQNSNFFSIGISTISFSQPRRRRRAIYHSFVCPVAAAVSVFKSDLSFE